MLTLAHSVVDEVRRRALVRLDVRGTPIVEMWHASTLGLGRALPAALALQRFATTPEATQAISSGRAGRRRSRRATSPRRHFVAIRRALKDEHRIEGGESDRVRAPGDGVSTRHDHKNWASRRGGSRPRRAGINRALPSDGVRLFEAPPLARRDWVRRPPLCGACTRASSARAEVEDPTARPAHAPPEHRPPGVRVRLTRLGWFDRRSDCLELARRWARWRPPIAAPPPRTSAVIAGSDRSRFRPGRFPPPPERSPRVLGHSGGSRSSLVTALTRCGPGYALSRERAQLTHSNAPRPAERSTCRPASSARLDAQYRNPSVAQPPTGSTARSTHNPCTGRSGRDRHADLRLARITN